MTRTILAHLNIELADDDPRTFEQVEHIIEGAVAVGFSGDETEGMTAAVALVDEIA